jgi:class 3 adenylate cyclase/pimeloyl-ACP methyl ester carboxylesterase
MERTVRYARNGDVHIAYQIAGDGPVDLVHTSGIWSNLDVMWDEPRWARYLGRLASFSRLILFDMRGVGLSDRGPEPPVAELQMDDVRAVMDAAGAETAVVFGGARGAAPSVLFAASYPERTRALILYAPIVRTLEAPDFPWGMSVEHRRWFAERFVSEMGTGENLDLQGRSAVDDERFKRWWARFERLVASPQAFAELSAVVAQFDVRSVLPSIQAPTLVVHRTEDPIVQVGQGRFVAERIPGARFVELAGVDHIPFLGDQDAILDEIEEFVTGARPAPDTDRVLATVLFTDIVGSTELAGRLADREWSRVLTEHHALVRTQLEVYRGQEIDTAGDGFMATFDGPARAIRCARTISEEVRSLGIEVRAGLHTGECQLVGSGLAGIAVHIAARICSLAAPGEVLTSGTVRELVAGSGITFDDRGVHQLKGVPEPWRVYRVSS